MTEYVFSYVDPNAADGDRKLTIEADHLRLSVRDGMVYAKDSNDKVRAAADRDDFLTLEELPETNDCDFVDARHLHDNE